jgi:hypothetical protein
LTLAQFLLPGESVLYESPGEVYYRRKPFALYVTDERLLLHAAPGRRSGEERAVAEPLAAVGLLEYSEGGLLDRRGRLRVHAADHTLTLTGEPNTIKEVWQALQRHAPRPAPVGTDEEATLVVPPPPLFENQPQAPARVQPLATAGPARVRGRFPSRAAVVAFVCVVAVAAVALALLLGRRVAPPAAPAEGPETVAAATPPPTPEPTPVTLQVMDEVFELEEGTHRAVRFSVPADRASARVSGGFRVTSDGHVDFYLMNSGQYERFARGGRPDVTSVLYREGQWNARVGERLPPGDYYLVFDNYDPDGDDDQTVAAEFFLILDEPPPAQ